MEKTVKKSEHNRFRTLLAVCAMTVTAMTLTGCGGMQDRLANIGKEPELTQIQNPVEQPGYRPVSVPMPAQSAEKTKPNSLWHNSRKTFFKDQRAQEIGDILTVMIEIDDEATLDNETSRTRVNEENADATQLLGLQSQLTKVLPEALDPTSLLDLGSDSSSTGTGSIEREEEISLMVAAMIIDVLPNGNLVIHGRQEVRVNYEVRELNITGIIRPEDISSQNAISYEKIAEARIGYGGRGQITDVQQPRYGQQFFDVVFPF